MLCPIQDTWCSPPIPNDGSVVGVIFAEVSVKRVPVGSEVGLENVQQAIAIIVTCGHAHTCLFAAVFVVGDARLRAYLLKELSGNIVVVKIWRGIAGYVDVGPAVVVKIRNQRAETVATLRPGDMNLVRDIGEISAAVVLIQRYGFRRQSARPA